MSKALNPLKEELELFFIETENTKPEVKGNIHEDKVQKSKKPLI